MHECAFAGAVPERDARLLTVVRETRAQVRGQVTANRSVRRVVAWVQVVGYMFVGGRYGRVVVSHVGLNDDVVEGLELRDADGALKSFSVQYHPEAAAGPHDASSLFDQFTELMARSAGRSSHDSNGKAAE